MSTINDEHFKVVYERINAAVAGAMADPRIKSMMPDDFFQCVLGTVVSSMVSVGIAPEPMLIAHILSRPTERGNEIRGRELLARRPPEGP